MNVNIIALLLAICQCFSSGFFHPRENTYPASYTQLGIPLSEKYPNSGRERTVWDIAVFDGKLFVGSGDYDTNAGPVEIPYYDLAAEKWLDAGAVPDEQISEFVFYGGTLAAPGIDPREDWTLGNFYTFNGEKWSVNRTIPQGIHTFSMLEYHGALFVGTGVPSGEYPISISTDGGNTFTQVPLHRDGAPVSTVPEKDENGKIPSHQIRVYNLWTFEDQLYALFSFYTAKNPELSVYRYQDGVFQYVSDFRSQVSFRRSSYDFICAQAEFQGRCFLSTGNLYATEDMVHFQRLALGENAMITDLLVMHDTLYLLAIEPGEQGYRTSVWKNGSGRYGDFQEVFYFHFPVPAQCFTYHENVFYFGMGEGTLSEGNPKNGAVLSVEYTP